MNEHNRARFDVFRSLSLPLGEYAITGSGPMGIRDLREIHDIDAIVTQALWNSLSGKYRVVEDKQVKRIVIDEHDIEFFCDFSFLAGDPQGAPSVSERIARAEVIDGLAFESLDHVLFFKRYMGRAKDLADIELIERWLTRSTNLE